jgi:hypothetical protein
MAKIPLAELTALLNDLPNQPVQSAVAQNRAFVFFSPVHNEWNNAGKAPMSVVMSDDGSGGGYTHSNGGAYNASVHSTLEQPRHPDWARYDGTIEFSDQDLEMLGQAGDTQVVNRLLQERGNTERRVWSGFNTDLMTNNYVSGDTDGVGGITMAISATNTYMGVARASNAWFQSHVVAVGGALTAPVLQAAIDTIIDTRKGRLDAIYTTRAIARTIAGFTSSATATYNVDIMGTSLLPLIGTRGPQGQEGLANKPECFFEGLPVYGIPGYPSGTCHGVALGEGGWGLTFQSQPMWGPFVSIPGESRAIATFVFRPQATYRNPWRNSFALTGIT